LVVWSALTFAAYTGYLGLAPWLRRRPVRVTPTSAVVSLVVALGPGLVYLVFQGAGGGQGVANLGLVAVAVVGGGLAVVGTAWRGTHVFHGTTAESFREAWRAALAHRGLAYEPLVGGSGRVERVALTGHRDRVELELRHGIVRGRGASGREVAADVAEAMDHYFDAHDTPVDRVGTSV
jgi:hypothetical protein